MRLFGRIGIAAALSTLVAGCSLPGGNPIVTTPALRASARDDIAPWQAWMDARASSADLVYVSNADGEVTVYNYSTQALVGVLAAFETPKGECVDKGGNVYIADAGTNKVYEYAHGGTKAIKTLDIFPYQPLGCAVDPTNGNLAVANNPGNSSDGNIEVFAHASGKKTVYNASQLTGFLSCAYDDFGSLLAVGYQGSGDGSYFVWLPKHGKALVRLDVPGPKTTWKWYGVTGIQWDGQFFALDDGGNGVYQIALIHGQAFWVSQTQFDTRYVGSAQYGIYDPNPKRQGTEILAGYNEESYSSGVDYFPYPQGGESSTGFSHGVDDPYAIAISLAK